MRSHQHWRARTQIVEDLGYSLIPPNLPRTQTGLVGNEVRTDCGKTSREKNGESENRSSQGFKNSVTELPVPRQKMYVGGLGDLGMEIIGKTTFANMKECWHEWKTAKAKQMGNDTSTNTAGI